MQCGVNDRSMNLQAWRQGLADVLSPSARNLPPLAQLVAAEDVANAGAIAMALPPAQVDRCGSSPTLPSINLSNE